MNATELLARIRQVGQISTNDEDWTSAEILIEAQQGLIERFSQPLQSTRSGYGLHRKTSSTVANQSSYQIPPRAVVGGLEKLEISSDGGVSYHEMPILTDSQATDYSGYGIGEPFAFSLESDRVVLYPTPSSASYTLKFSYYLRPSSLVTTVANGIVNSVSIISGVPTLGVATMPAGLGGSGTLDCIHTLGSFELSLVGESYNAAFGLVIFGSSVDISRVNVGDVVRVTETSDYIPLPFELHRALADYTAAVILAAKGDFDKAKILNGKTDTAIARFVDMALPRVKDRPFVFKSRNSYLRRRIGSGLGRY